jgi:metallo-beta-lactamase family protein
MASTLCFYGGVGSVTGANFLLDTGTIAILVDCGLVQGDRFAQEVNAEPFAYNPADVDVLFVTHAHADHIGRVPKLIKDGFKGAIYSTEPTRELAHIMLRDALKVMEFEQEKYGTEVIYDAGHIDKAMQVWKTVAYDESIVLDDGIKAHYTDAGHILGSGMLHIERNGKKIVFTGDIGNDPQPLLNPPVVPTEYDYMVMESVYGNRVHEEVKERTALLEHYIKEAQKKGGTLIIPAFSLERTQGMLLEINNLVESGRISPLPVFLDSPLAIAVTEVYRKYTHYLKSAVQEQIKNGDDIFDFEGLSFTETKKDSQDIQKEKGAKIIIAGSGMSHGGRIRAHEKNFLGETNATLLLVGYQAIGSLGRLLHDGAKKVRIDGEEVKVRAQIASIRGFSGHADRDQLVSLVAHGGEKAKHIFVTMGEEASSLFLVQRLRDYLGIKATAPSLNEEVEIDF